MDNNKKDYGALSRSKHNIISNMERISFQIELGEFIDDRIRISSLFNLEDKKLLLKCAIAPHIYCNPNGTFINPNNISLYIIKEKPYITYSIKPNSGIPNYYDKDGNLFISLSDHKLLLEYNTLHLVDQKIMYEPHISADILEKHIIHNRSVQQSLLEKIRKMELKIKSKHRNVKISGHLDISWWSKYVRIITNKQVNYSLSHATYDDIKIPDIDIINDECKYKELLSNCCIEHYKQDIISVINQNIYISHCLLKTYHLWTTKQQKMYYNFIKKYFMKSIKNEEIKHYLPDCYDNYDLCYVLPYDTPDIVKIKDICYRSDHILLCRGIKGEEKGWNMFFTSINKKHKLSDEDIELEEDAFKKANGKIIENIRKRLQEQRKSKKQTKK